MSRPIYLCKFLQESDIQDSWWGTLVVQQKATVRRAIDGSGEVFVRLPAHIQSESDVDDKYKDLFNQFAPYDHSDNASVIMRLKSPIYQAEDD